MRVFPIVLFTGFAAFIPFGAPALAYDHDDDQGSKVVAAYYQNFHVYSGNYPRHLVTSGAAAKLNILTYAFIDIRADQNGAPHCAAFDEFADYQYNFTSNTSIDATNDSFANGALRGQVHQLQELKKQFPKMKILASIGGFSAGVKGFEAAAATPASRQAFVADCIKSYVGGNFGNTTGLAPTFDSGFSEQPAIAINPVPGIFDGFDVDWEFPTQPQDRVNFVALLKEFRKQLDAAGPGHVLSAALPAGQQNFSLIDLPGAAKQVDFVNLETFDYSGPFNNHTGFVAPLFQTPFDPSPTFNVDFTVRSYLSAGVPASKILMGIPFYAYGWSITGTSAPGQNGQFVASIDPNSPSSGKPPTYAGSFAIQVNPNLANVAATEPDSFLILNILPFSQLFRDPKSQSPWAFDGLNFWTYDDAQSIAFKMQYAREHGLRGAFIFEEPDELPDGSLLKAVWRGLQ
jgi:chitinase